MRQLTRSVTFALREQSATGLGMSFAGVAAGSAGISSMYWNPATMTMAPGFQSEFHATAIIPESKITPVYTIPSPAQPFRNIFLLVGHVQPNALCRWLRLAAFSIKFRKSYDQFWIVERA